MSVLNRTYTADSGLIAIGVTTAVPAFYIAPTATNDIVICRIKVQVEATSNQSASPSTNNSILFQLSTVTGAVGGGASITPKQVSGTTLAANTVFKSGSTALTGLTQTTEFWQNAIALSAGAWAEDAYENTGLEIPLPASSLSCFYFTAASGFGSNLSARITVTGVE